MKILYLLIVISLFSCSSLKETKLDCTTNSFENFSGYGDSLKFVNKDVDFSIIKSKNWNRKTEDKNPLLYFKNDSLINDIQNPVFYIIKHNSKKECLKENDKEKFLMFIKEIKLKKFTNFNPNIIKFNHKIFGDYYILQFAISSFKRHKIIVTKFLFFYNNAGYDITYTSDSNYYEKYLTDVEEMVNSFRVIE